MTDEVRNISIAVQASQAIRSLTTVGTKMSNMTTLVGQSDAVLKRAENQIAKYSRQVIEAASTISRLKDGQKQLATDLAAANRQVAKQNRLLLEARGQVDGAKVKTKEFANALKTANNTIDSQAKKIERLKAAVRSYQQSSASGKTFMPVSDKALANISTLIAKTPGLLAANRTQNGATFSRPNTALINQQSAALGGLQSRLRMSTAGQVAFTASSKNMLVGTRSNVKATEDLSSANVGLRYALYSTATTFGLITAAGKKAYDDLFSTGINFQKNMANVVRTSQVASAGTWANSPLVTGGIISAEQQTKLATQQLTQSFLDLQASIPVSSEDLTTIGTLAAQMGIAAADISDFTAVTAKFAAATGIGAEEAATGIARLGQLSGIKEAGISYEQLASGILKTGVNSIATEHQILQAANNIASISNVAHLSSAQITALASAMSSLGITSELQRSTITTSFTKILSATNSGAAAAQKYGNILGISGQQFIDAWGTNAYNTFVRLTGAIAAGKDSVGTLQDLGLSSQRLTPTLLKIGQNTEVFSDSLKDATAGQKENNELSRQFDIIAQTTASRLQVLSQTWDKFLIIIGGPAVDAIGGIAKSFGDVINKVAEFAATPVGQVISNIVIVVGLLATVFFSILTAVSLAAAAILGLGFVVDQLGISSVAAAEGTGLLSIAIDKQAASALLASGKTALLAGSMGMLKATFAAIISPAGLATLAIIGLIAAVNNATPINNATRNLEGLSNKLSDVEKGLMTDTTQKAAVGGASYTRKSDFSQIASGPSGGFLGLDRGLGGLFGSNFGNVRQVDEGLAKLAAKSGPAANAELQKLNKSWIANKGSQEGFAAAFPDTLAALSLNAGKVGATTEELKLYYSGIAEAQTAEETLTNLQQSQADVLGIVTDGFVDAKKAHEDYVSSIQQAGSSFFDIGTMLDNAYGKDKGQGGGLGRLQKDLNKQVDAYKKWSDGIRRLTVEGAGALAQSFIEQGPSSQQAVEDALKLSPKARTALNQSMRDAAFFASQAYAETFTAQNAVLADVYSKTLKAGGDPLKALHDAEKMLGSGDALSQKDIRALERKYGIHIDVTLSGIDPKDASRVISNAQHNAQAVANAKPIIIKMKTKNGGGFTGEDPTVKEYSVTEEGHNIVLKVNPDTKKGEQILNAWRENQYNTPVKFKADIDTTAATAKLVALRGLMNNVTYGVVDVNVHSSAAPNRITRRAKGGGIDIPGFATGGTYVRGPGTDTSDSILARLSRGEYVNTAASVRYYGASFFEALNRRQFPKYAQGGGHGTSAAAGAGATMNVNVVQNYPTTVDPLKKLKQDSENLVAGLWS